MPDGLKQTGKPDDSHINVDQEHELGYGSANSAEVAKRASGQCQRELVASDRAMTSVEEFVSRQDAAGTFESLVARVDALRFKLYIVNHILGEIMEATSGRAIDEERD
jgi:hypothetical protein